MALAPLPCRLEKLWEKSSWTGGDIRAILPSGLEIDETRLSKIIEFLKENPFQQWIWLYRFERDCKCRNCYELVCTYCNSKDAEHDKQLFNIEEDDIHWSNIPLTYKDFVGELHKHVKPYYNPQFGDLDSDYSNSDCEIEIGELIVCNDSKDNKED